MKPRHLTPAQVQCILDAQPKRNLYCEELTPKTALKELCAMLLCLWLLIMVAGLFS